jgi:cytochrome c554/c'-like protein
MDQMLSRCAWIAVLAVGVGGIGSRSEAAPAPASVYTSAQQCAKCHQAIHVFWSESEHSRSATSKPFLAALAAAVGAAPDKDAARRACVWCHAPTALASGDYALEGPIAREGVTCDFCHTVADVDLRKPGHPFELQPGKVKRGPLEYVKSPPFHDTAYSVLHKSSPLLCASCHEHQNAHGVPVLSTYTEWMAGPYPARGQTCQECHMPLVARATVKQPLQSTQRRINLHWMQGGSAASRLQSGLDLKISSLDVGAASADVQVTVTNSGVGHAAPGGLSSKSLVLAVGVDTGAGQPQHRREKVYRRELKDAEGHGLSSVADMFQKAVSVGADSLPQAKETRNERFTVPLPEGWRAIVARLEYRDESDPAGPKTTLVTEVRRERGR